MSRGPRDDRPQQGRLAVVALLATCLIPFAAGTLAQVGAEVSAGPRTPYFRDVTREAGIDFTHFTGASGELYFVETVGAGAALFDYDGDGDLDLYLVQSAMLGPKGIEAATFSPRGPLPLSDRLLRNDLDPGAAGDSPPRFVDVTEASGIRATGYGMGVATGDYDRDGHVDLYVTNFGPNQLWRNNGDGTFVDRTREAGADDPRWSVAAAFLDYDLDGWLDLYVGNYTNFRLASNKRCHSASGFPDYCAPGSYDPEPARLLRNRGDGTFEDATARAGVGEPGYTLGAVTADFDGDGWVDIFVALDQMPNQLWINQRDGTFVNEALLRGCAVNAVGIAEAGMGVDAGDVDQDGDLDVFITHFSQETNTLYLNDGAGGFEDATQASGLGPPSWPYTGFGTGFLDYDNDGRLDVLVVNGAVRFIPELYHARDPYPLHEPDQLFRNLGGGRFEDVTANAGPAFALPEVGRGAAFGDIDNDGDTDVVITNNNGPARLLRNEVGSARRWIGLRLVDRHGGDDVPGATVEVAAADGAVFLRLVRGGASYVSAHDPRVLVGLGDAEGALRARVRWPSGRIETFTGLPERTYTDLREGRGVAEEGGG